MKEKLSNLWRKVEVHIQRQFGFQIQDATFGKIVNYLHEPKDASSLAITRILFGLAMLIDIPDERGGAALERRWGNPSMCHFPLLWFLRPLPMPYMAVVYAAMWFGALGLMLGYKYTLTSATFAACYWYLLLIEKSFWNNHSYLFGLVAILLACSDAGRYWSLDVYLDPTKMKETVPYWNYFILKYQFFILYFMAGLKKSTAEWLTGYSVQKLSEHWVFAPFRLFLSVEQTDYLVVHWFIFWFDLTVAVWMMWSRTRHVAMLFCALFHLMNSRLFRIGMFPWVCLATMPLFYPFDWPKLTVKFINKHLAKLQNLLCWNIARYTTEFKCKLECEIDEIEPHQESLSSDDMLVKQNENGDDSFKIHSEENKDFENANVEFIPENNKDLVEAFLDSNAKESEHEDQNKKAINEGKSDSVKNIVVYMTIFFVVTQAFLPFSHFITKGFNNWTNGLYGYSWDMMVHTWEPHSIIIKVVDNEKNIEFYIDPHLFAPNDRWSRHGDMVYQYAHCLKNNILDARKRSNGNRISSNISIYVDVWCSMNGRFAQRMFDPKVDMLKANWSPFQAVSFLMPILDEAEGWRGTLDKIREDVHAWSNYSDVTFFADFPGYAQEKYIPNDLQNVTLTVLQGVVAYEPELSPVFNGHSMKLGTGQRLNVRSGTFHKVLNIGESYSYYMYTFFNSTEAITGVINDVPKPMLPIGSELKRRCSNMVKFSNIVLQSLYKILFHLCSRCN